ncbi:MAG: thiosulfate sulfurtransferase GlpE [Gammaproteobacteria bacterium]|nr:thiosulfate sulfurtransferase GlpE [Gammaproteobacteria bacterium]
MPFTRISIDDVQTKLTAGPVTLADIRDPQSYAAGHLDGAQHLTNQNLDSFIRGADLDLPLVVYCYHGNSSQGAADYLSNQGFSEVYSMDGGFEAWKQKYPAVGV